jgi:hypothetical protein
VTRATATRLPTRKTSTTRRDESSIATRPTTMIRMTSLRTAITLSKSRVCSETAGTSRGSRRLRPRHLLRFLCNATGLTNKVQSQVSKPPFPPPDSSTTSKHTLPQSLHHQFVVSKESASRNRCSSGIVITSVRERRETGTRLMREMREAGAIVGDRMNDFNKVGRTLHNRTNEIRDSRSRPTERL